jgi:hypothetical protein
MIMGSTVTITNFRKGRLSLNTNNYNRAHGTTVFYCMEFLSNEVEQSKDAEKFMLEKLHGANLGNDATVENRFRNGNFLVITHGYLTNRTESRRAEIEKYLRVLAQEMDNKYPVAPRI